MTASHLQSVLLFLLILAACIWAAPLLPSTGVNPQIVVDDDVELVEVDHTGKLAGSPSDKEEERYDEMDATTNDDDASAEGADVLIIQSSMVTPFLISTAVVIGPGGSVLVPDEPNFFWSGSGDDPDAGMTYWITTTVTRTSLVTIQPPPPTSPPPTTSAKPPAPPTTTTTTIRPTPRWTTEDATPPSVDIAPQYWIRTVFRPDPGADESSPSFRRLVHSTLRLMYGRQENLLARLGGANSSSALSAVQVMIQNITRRASSGNVDVLYALLMTSAVPVDPQMASAILSSRDDDEQQSSSTRELATLCPQHDQADVLKLCRSVVTRAEPFMARSETSPAAVAALGTSWLVIGSVLGGVLVLIVLVIVLAYILSRNKRMRKQKEAAGSGSALAGSLPVPSSTLVLDQQRKKAVRSQGTATVEEDPDPWVRKARSTSKKHGRDVQRHSRRNSSRPVTAPARPPTVARRPSTSSLSAVAYSGSSSASSPFNERLNYRLTREEPVQQSRGARRLKKKHRSHHGPSSITSELPVKSRTKKDKARKSKAPQDAAPDPSIALERPVPKPRTTLLAKPAAAADDTETQEISADFTACPDEDDDDAAAPPSSEVVGSGWGPPGSLIPSRVTGAIFGSRKVSSAPAGTISGGNESTDVVTKSAARGWVSSDQLPAVDDDDDGRDNNNIQATVVVIPDTKETPSQQPKRHPPLHIHSSSFPAWPSLGDADPAIDLINTIKAELKKFEHR